MVTTLAADVRAIERALADRLTIIHTVIDPDGSIVATYRKTVLLPRDSRNEPHSKKR